MDKISVITGSTRGIGKQIGIDLLDKGYFVYFNHAHDNVNISFLDNKYRKYKVIKADLSGINEISKLNKISKLDILILNMGITDRSKFGQLTYKNWEKVINTNLTIPFFLVQSLRNKIRENGRIIFISSISGIVPDSTSIPYGVSKAGINMMVKYLAREFAPKKITVNAIAPGYTMTSWHKSKSKAQIKRIEKKILLNRFAEPKEISKTVLSIIDNDYINGQVIQVDGGFGLC